MGCHEDEQPRRYTTLRDAIEQEILPALDNPDNYDVEAIAAKAFDYRVDHDADGKELLNTAGFEQIVSTEEFWALVQEHDKSPGA